MRARFRGSSQPNQSVFGPLAVCSGGAFLPLPPSPVGAYHLSSEKRAFPK